METAFANAATLPNVATHRRAALSPACVRRPRAATAAAAGLHMTSTARRQASADLSAPRSGEVGVRLTRPSRDTRHVRASVRVRAPLRVVWALLTDYGNLATHVPNLAESTIVRGATCTTTNGAEVAARVRQAGAQRILGFEFRAAVTLDMVEVQRAGWRAVHFARTPDDRGDFSAFHGTWKLVQPQAAPDDTELHYDVTVSPRGLVPVAAIEWRIADARRARARNTQTLRIVEVTQTRTRTPSPNLLPPTLKTWRIAQPA